MSDLDHHHVGNLIYYKGREGNND